MSPIRGDRGELGTLIGHQKHLTDTNQGTKDITKTVITSAQKLGGIENDIDLRNMCVVLDYKQGYMYRPP